MKTNTCLVVQEDLLWEKWTLLQANLIADDSFTTSSFATTKLIDYDVHV